MLGGVAIATLPVAQYPSITPPTIQVTASYPGASARTMVDKVALPIEQAVNGVKGMIYMQSSCTNEGNYSLIVSFDIGTDPNEAQILVQNRVSQALAQLPKAVQTQGVVTQTKSTAILQIITLTSPNNEFDALFLNNYATLNLENELVRVHGVGGVTVFGVGQYSMRIWLDPAQLQARSLVPNDVIEAIQAQNTDVTARPDRGGPGSARSGLSSSPSTSTAALVPSREFEEIVVKSDTAERRPHHAAARCRPRGTRLPAVRTIFQIRRSLRGWRGDLSTTRLELLDTAKRVRAKMAELAEVLPSGLTLRDSFRYDDLRQRIDQRGLQDAL